MNKSRNIEKNVKAEKDNKEPLVSVIVPTYNVETYVKQCIDSLLNQTYENIEVICIDDGSTDNTIRILEFLAAKDERLIIVKQDHKGVSAARNVGLDIAKGKYISFVDSDDYVSWNNYEILVEVAETNELDLIIFGGNPVGDAPDWIMKKLNTKYKYYKRGHRENIVFIEESARPFLWLHFIKRELLEKDEKIRFNEKMEMGEDQLFQFQYIPRADAVMILEDKLYNYRIARNCSLMQLYEKQPMKKFDSHIILASNVIETWKKSDLFEKNEDEILTWITNLTYWSLINFPLAFQPDLAKKVVGLIERYNIQKYLISWYEKKHLDYIYEISKEKYDIETEKREIEKRMNREIFEIQSTINSKAFKLGRRFVTKSERMDMGPFKKYLN